MPVLANVKKNNDDVDRSHKNKISMILNNKEFDWIDINDHAPDAGVPVVVRILNESIIYAEDDENVIYGEDEKIARLSKKINDSDEHGWLIEPPYTKYDYSPLTQKDRMIEGSVVTHWAPIDDEVLDAWSHRLDISGDYAHLSLEVSQEYEEIVYRTLLTAANYIARSVEGNLEAEKNQREMAMYGILTDLQACLDLDVHVSNGTMIKNPSIEFSDIEDAYQEYSKLLEKCGGDSDKLSKLIRTMQLINRNPENLKSFADDIDHESDANTDCGECDDEE